MQKMHSSNSPSRQSAVEAIKWQIERTERLLEGLRRMQEYAESLEAGSAEEELLWEVVGWVGRR